MKHTTTFYDGLGRQTQVNVYESSNTYLQTTQSYDGLGRVASSTNPSRNTSGSSDNLGYATTTAYDALNRPLLVTNPDGGTVQWGYSFSTNGYIGDQTMQTDGDGKVRNLYSDGLGRLTTVVEDPSYFSYLTTYTHDVLDNLTGVNQAGQTRTFVYDSLSELTSATNPESGTTTYSYDLAGTVTQRNSAAQNTSYQKITVYGYDALNRVKSKNYYIGNTSNADPATPSTSYLYDATFKGAMDWASNSASNLNFTSYDALGRVTATAQVTAGAGYTMSYTYDLTGAMTNETYPSKRVVTTGFDDVGRVNGVTGTGSKTYAGTFVYKPDGSYDNYLLGNGLTQSYIYDYSIRPQWMITQKSGAASPVLRLNNTWDHNGNLTNVSQFNALSNGDAGSGQNLVYQYDNVNRLSTATETTGGTTNWSRTFNYDQYGNMWVGAAPMGVLRSISA